MTLWLAPLFILVIFLLRRFFTLGRRGARFPPGPPTWPVIGNLASMPTKHIHLRFTEWAREYGPIYSLKLGPQTMIVLSSAQAITELIDKRSTSTGDRPCFPVGDIVTDRCHIALLNYGPVWRLLRKAAYTILTPKAIQDHTPIQLAEANQLLYDFLHNPEDFEKHLGRYTSSVTMSILFGNRSPRYETKETTDFFRQMALWNQIMAPGAQPPIDLLPFLKYVPKRWAAWKRHGAEVRHLQHKLYFGLLDKCNERVRLGKENGSFMEGLIKNQHSLGLDWKMLGHLAGALLEGGIETMATVLKNVPLMLTAFPGVQKRAQEEVDQVIGDRLPTMEDIDSLPYIRCLLQEIHRFRPIFPLGIPHASIRDEEYSGYFIRKGSTIVLNTWGLFHDPEVFDQPDTFSPDRFLLTEYGTKPGVDDTAFRSDFVFGGGRRACPGIHFAEKTLMLNVTNMVWAFNFSPPFENDGPRTVDITDYFDGMEIGPRPYECKIEPRSDRKTQLIEEGFVTATNIFRVFEYDLDEEEKLILEEERSRQQASIHQR